ncbi:MAG TPA: saccharopine dehydrogenase NADP-binding domain-containing protein [Mycobacteriales bacterium]|jgi:short subunit dehydrogenase-like uncharacterized protein|nr:saccharopine dehydrogenase NADP-binding domain-containing protein [Mycobacteriales bacterium]
MADDRELDVVVYGATGFVGKLTAAALAKSGGGARIGLAGRSQDKLQRTRADLGPAAAELPLIAVDAADEAGLRDLAGRTRAVVTSVGPYCDYGMPLLAACAAAGTHYADLTGEAKFVREAADRYDGTARESGARIVNACGFDSIPSDLGVFALHQQVRADGEGELEETTLVVRQLKGGVSGGTLATMKNTVDEMKRSKEFRRFLADPYNLSPDRGKEPDLGDESDPRRIARDREIGRWLAPFVMSSYNTRIVRRSNALLDYAYGRRFRYQEYMSFPAHPGGLAAAVGVTAGYAALGGGLMLPPTRKLLDRMLPDPGEGPSEKTQRNGRFRLEIHATTSTGARYVCDVAGTGDPGYAATAVMFAQSGLAMALDGERLPAAAGVLTPASGVGQPLLDRLRGEGFTYDARRV